MTSLPALDTASLDLALTERRAHAPSWTATPLAERIGLLERMLPRTGAEAAAGREPVPAKSVPTRNGRTVVDVFPATATDRLLLNGFTAEDGPASRPSRWCSAPGTSPPSRRPTSCTSCTRRARSSSPR
ncbi:hypothetical protein ABTX77_12995 [Streptomyces sp. NPDC097704]|uniref:hypothetical protein n=1 Tax=Streptomyces sp. NPDC097704 TaxID=3157101 RepID=UPI0033246747